MDVYAYLRINFKIRQLLGQVSFMQKICQNVSLAVLLEPIWSE